MQTATHCARHVQVQGIIATAVRDVIGLDVSMEAPLAASGLDSLAAVELQGALSR